MPQRGDVHRSAHGSVLLLGSESRILLPIIRSLGRRGIRVHVGWCPSAAIALRSRYVTRVHHLPAFRSDDPRWRDALLSLVRRERFDLVIPCDDPAILPLQHHREELEAAGRIYLLDPEPFRITMSKVATGKLAERLGIPVPRQLEAHTSGDGERILQLLRLPAILKPHSSFTLDDLAVKRHVQRVDTPDELRRSLADLLRHGPVLAQEFFPGEGTGVEVLARDGEILYAFQHARVHEPLAGGGSSYRTSVGLDPALLEATRAMLRALRYTGVGMVEFKVDRGSGRWILVEVNGRFWGSLPLAIAAGADFPYYLYQLLVMDRVRFPSGYRLGIYCRNWSRDAVWLWHNIRADRSDPKLMTRPLPAVVGEMRNFFTLRERSDTLAIDDPRPAVAEAAALLRTAARMVARRRGAWRPRFRGAQRAPADAPIPRDEV